MERMLRTFMIAIITNNLFGDENVYMTVSLSFFVF